MSCETLHLTGVVRDRSVLPCSTGGGLHVSGTVGQTFSVTGSVTRLVLTAVVDSTVSLTGRCRQA